MGGSFEGNDQELGLGGWWGERGSDLNLNMFRKETWPVGKYPRPILLVFPRSSFDFFVVSAGRFEEDLIIF